MLSAKNFVGIFMAVIPLWDCPTKTSALSSHRSTKTRCPPWYDACHKIRGFLYIEDFIGQQISERFHVQRWFS